MQIQEPTKCLLQNIYELSDFLSSPINLSQLEIAIDFYTENRIILKKFIEKHLYLKYSRTDSLSVGTTYYPGDVRKPVKGIRLYPKSINNRPAVRLELVLKRSAIKRNGLSPTLSNLDTLYFDKFFDFREVDMDKLLNSRLHRFRGDLKKLGGKRSLLGGLFVNTVNGSISRHGETVMDYAQALKQYPCYKKSYGRFIRKLPELNQVFFSKVNGQVWID